MKCFQTVKDFVTKPISGIVPIDTTVTPIPDWQVTGVPTPTYYLEYLPSIADVTDVPTPWALLWRRPATRLVR